MLDIKRSGILINFNLGKEMLVNDRISLKVLVSLLVMLEKELTIFDAVV